MRVAAIHLCRVNINKRRNPSLPLPVGCAPCRAVKVENGITVCCVPANNNNTVERQQQLFLFLGFLATYEHFSCSNFINNNWQHTHTHNERERKKERKLFTGVQQTQAHAHAI